jgi:hypothetical protein
MGSLKGNLQPPSLEIRFYIKQDGNGIASLTEVHYSDIPNL